MQIVAVTKMRDGFYYGRLRTWYATLRVIVTQFDMTIDIRIFLYCQKRKNNLISMDMASNQHNTHLAVNRTTTLAVRHISTV